MKTFYYLFILVFVISCANPQKLVENSEYEKALNVSTRRLKKGKAKWKNLDAFEKSFRELTMQDSMYVKSLRAEGRPEVWPEIYDKAVAISKRQLKVTPVLNRLNGSDFEPVISLYPADALLEEAADNSALYYYAGALEFLETARSGNRQDARQAYNLLRRCRDYRTNFKDAPLMQQEMYEIGTTHIAIQALPTRFGQPIGYELVREVINGKKYPYREAWHVFHIDAPKNEEIDYFAQLQFHDLNIGWERESFSCCRNSEEVEVGCIEEKQWNAKDSVWVTVRVPVFETVSVEIRTYEQEKSASLQMNYNLIDAQSGETVIYRDFRGSVNWENVYSEVCGDTRALSFMCEDEGGYRQSYPNDSFLLLSAACDVRRGFYRELRRGVD